jgi:hypothetical protein
MCDGGLFERRWLGWYIPRADGKVDVGRSTEAWSQESWIEFQQRVRVITDLRPFVIDYLAVNHDFTLLSGVEAAIVNALERNMFDFAGVEQTVALAKAQGALSNFLFSASAFRDRAQMRLKELHGPESHESRKLKTAIKVAYDDSFSYRLLYNLRNFAQHHDSPLSVIPVHGARQDSGQIKFSVSLVLRPRELLRSSLIQQSFVRELRNYSGDTEKITSLATGYMRSHNQLMKTLLDMNLTRLRDLGEGLIPLRPGRQNVVGAGADAC